LSFRRAIFQISCIFAERFELIAHSASSARRVQKRTNWVGCLWRTLAAISAKVRLSVRLKSLLQHN
jgi:hypothetical protein